MSIPSFVLVQGVITGLSYGLLAMGLVLIYRTNRVLNFAQGQLGVVAAVFMVKCFYDFGFNYWFALALSLALAAAVGALSELLLRRLFNRPRVLVMVATIGLSQVLFVFTALPFIRPKNLFKPFPVPFNFSFSIGTYLFTPGQVLTLVTRDPNVHAITDFGPTARIAVPSVKQGPHSLVIGMALDKALGAGSFNKLDSIQVQSGHADAVTMILNPSHEVNSHFSTLPYVDTELKSLSPKIHTVLPSLRCSAARPRSFPPTPRAASWRKTRSRPPPSPPRSTKPTP